MNLLVVVVPLGLLVTSAVAVFLVGKVGRTSGQVLAARLEEQPLAHELPYWSFLDDGGTGVAIHVDLTYSTLLKVQGVDVDCVDAETLRQINTGLHGVL